MLKRPSTTALTAAAIFIISLVIFFVITPGFLKKVYFGAPTGDEPYYLLIAHSIIHDHDIELTNNFDNQDYLHYYPGELYPRHEAKTTRPGLYSKHMPGVSLLIAPFYAIGDWHGSVFFYNFLGALLAANIYLLGYEISRKQWVGILLWLTFSFTNPLMSYTFLIFPALVSALMTVYAYRRIRLDGVVAPLTGNGVVRMFLVGICLGFMPWLHARFLPISFVLFAYLVWREVTIRRRAAKAAAAADTVTIPPPAIGSGPTNGMPKAGAGAAAAVTASAPLEQTTAPAPQFVHGWRLAARSLAFFIPAAICAITFEAYFEYLYSTFLPNYGDHAGMGSPPEWVVAFFGSFLDQQWGLLIYAPIYILAIVGFIWMARQHKREDLFWIAAISIPYAMVILTYKQWWGEWCPPARYWVSLIPLLVVPMGYMLSGPVKKTFMAVYFTLAAISWAIMAVFIYHPKLMYNQPDGSSELFKWLVHGDMLQPLVPTYFQPEWINVWLTVIYIELIIAIVWLAWRQIKKPAAPV